MVSREVAEVCLYDHHLAEAFDRFRRVIWPSSRERPASAGGVDGGVSEEDRIHQRQNPIFVFVKGDSIVGHVGTIPVRLSLHGEARAAHWIVGFNVLLEYRNGLVGPLLIKEVNRTLDCALSLHVEPPVLRILTGLKWDYPGMLPQYIRILSAKGVTDNVQLLGVRALASRAGRFSVLLNSRLCDGPIRIVARWALALMQGIRAAIAGLPSGTPTVWEVREEHAFDESYDQLWQSVRGQFQACIVRDLAYLESRFGRGMDRYRVLACRCDGQLLGYCVLKVKQFQNDSRMGCMRVGTIVDCLYDPRTPEVFQSLLVHTGQLCRKDNIHAILCTASHAAVRQVLAANGFWVIPGNLNFACHSRADVLLRDVPLESWHLMRGDSDADQNF